MGVCRFRVGFRNLSKNSANNRLGFGSAIELKIKHVVRNSQKVSGMFHTRIPHRLLYPVFGALTRSFVPCVSFCLYCTRTPGILNSQSFRVGFRNRNITQGIAGRYPGKPGYPCLFVPYRTPLLDSYADESRVGVGLRRH